MDAISLAWTVSIGAAPAHGAWCNGTRTALTYEERDWSFSGLHQAALRVARSRLSSMRSGCIGGSL